MSSDKSISPQSPAPRRVPNERPGPSGGKRDLNRKRRTAELAQAGLELFLERGVEAVTIDEIVRAAGVAKGTFYRYFKGKEELVGALIAPVTDIFEDGLRHANTALQRATNADLAGAYLGIALTVVQAMTRYPDVLKLYLQESRGPAIGARRPIARLADTITRQSLVLTRLAVDHGLLRPRDPRVSALAVVGAGERLLHAQLSGDDLGEPGAVAQALIEMVLDGLRPPPR